jgi:hypothetical protein
MRTVTNNEFFEVASALQKSIRRGLLDEAIYRVRELHESNYAAYAWKRLRIITSEDVGLAEPGMAALIDGLYSLAAPRVKQRQNCADLLVHATAALVRAKKSRIVDHATLFVYSAKTAVDGGRFFEALMGGDEETALAQAAAHDRDQNLGEWVWAIAQMVMTARAGLAEPTLPADFAALYRAWTDLRKKRDTEHYPERLFLIHACLRVVRSLQSSVVHAYNRVAFKDLAPRPIPDYALDKHTRRGRAMKRGWDHFFTEGMKLANEADLPDAYRERAIAMLKARDEAKGRLQPTEASK